MKTLRLSWAALSLACLVPLLAAAPQGATATKTMKLSKKSLTKDSGTQKKLTEAQKDFQRLNKEGQKIRMAYFKKMREDAKKQAAEGKGRKAVRSFSMGDIDMSSLTPEYVACARKYQGTDDAIMFLTGLLSISKDKDVQDNALSTLWMNHYESDKLASWATTVPRLSRALGKERCNKIMDKLSKSPNKNVQGAVLYSKASTALRNRKIDADGKAKAHAELELAIKLAPKASFTPRAKGILFEASNLQVGMKAPDITGKDTDGVAFKTSDYLGKVILLDFWGDW
jgi:hypothetical protein